MQDETLKVILCYARKSYHLRERRKFRHQAEQYVLEYLLSIEEAGVRQKTAGPVESIETGRSYF